MEIRFAAREDAETLFRHDRWINREKLEDKIAKKQILVAYEGEAFAGWLRYGLFWDNTPFLYMLRILEPCRGHGIGSAMMARWEAEMKLAGYQTVLTSTAQTESAQHFYDKIGYRAIGGFLLEKEPLELILQKNLRS